MRVAAVQMHAVLGDVAANLENAEHWVRLALREGAQWIVLPEFQGRGIATRATQLMAERAWADAPDRPIHAYPSVDNPASNAVCRKAGFRLIGAFDFEYPPGHPLRCNDWVLDPPH